MLRMLWTCTTQRRLSDGSDDKDCGGIHISRVFRGEWEEYATPLMNSASCCVFGTAIIYVSGDMYWRPEVKL